MAISIYNGYPVSMKNVNLRLTNVENKEVVVDTTFLLIPSKSTALGNIGLAGKTIEGVLEANVKLDLAAGNNVLIDTNDFVRAIMTVRKLDVQEATAIFPAQSVIKDTIDIELENMGSRELDFVVLEKGQVRIVANSTLEDVVYFTYSLPGVYAPGSTTSFSVNNKIGPAPANGSVPGVWEYDFSGYTLDLRGQKRNSHNKLFSDLEGRIQYTGKKVNLSLQDSFYVKIFTTGIKPKYAKGYLGDTIVTISDTVAVAAFDKIPAGNINFEQAKISIDLENELGVGGKVNVNNITAFNPTYNPSKVELIDNNLIGKDLVITGATDNPLKSSHTNIGTSNAAPIINISPKSISYRAEVKVGEPVKSYDNFMYNEKFVKSTLNIEIPLAFRTNGFQLSDTVDLSPTFSSDLKNGTFTVAARNGFPLAADLSLIFLGENGLPKDSLTTTERLESANIDPMTKRVMKDAANQYIKKTSRISYKFDQSRLANIHSSKKIIFKVKFYTQADGSTAKIYDDYTIDFKLIGDFKYGM
jgi:hypothetical protein